METRYRFLSLLLLFCATLLAQSKRGVEVIAPAAIEKSPSIFDQGDLALLSDQNPHHAYHFEARNPCKVFIGVGTLSDAATGGLKVDYTVDNTPATIYGIQAGDIILTLDNVAVHSQLELERERDKHAQGDAFTLDILRGDSKITIQARFKACTEEELEETKQQEEMAQVFQERFKQMHVAPHAMGEYRLKERAILGFYKADDVEGSEGIVIGSVVEGKGAAAAGLKTGDIITTVNGQTLTRANSLQSVLLGHKPGEQVTVVFLRDGQTLTTEVVLSKDRNTAFNMRERNPCEVFIGVYVSDHAIDGKGARISSVIDGTPAKESNLQAGDIILALDDQPVESNATLVAARDKHQPGDPFRMTVLRDGVTMDVSATFKACPKDKESPATTLAPEVVELGKVYPETPQISIAPKPTLELNAFDAYPNPTWGPVNVRFEAKAVPITVRITDITGKMVYNNQLNQFSGSFNEQINLDGNSPGIYTVSIEQEGKVFVKKIILLSRV